MPSPTVGSARVGLVPDATGFAAKADSELQGPARELGESIGRTIGQEIGDRIASGIADGFAKGDRDALPRIAELREELKAIGDVKVKVDVDSGDALAKVGALGEGEKSIGGLTESFSGLASTVSSASADIPFIGSVSVGAAAIAIPAILGIVTAIAAIASTVVVATGGLAVLAAIAIPIIKDALKAKGAGQSKQTVAFLAAVAKFKGIFAGLLAGFKPVILTLVTQALTLMAQILPSLVPIIAGAATGLGDLLNNGSQFIPVIQQIATNFAAVEPGAIVAVGNAFLTALPALANFAIQLAPLGAKILPLVLGAIGGLVAGLRTVGQSTAFQQIFAAIKADAPAFLSALKSMGILLGGLLTAIAPFVAFLIAQFGPQLAIAATALRTLVGVTKVVEVAFLGMSLYIGRALLAVLAPIATVVEHMPGVPAAIKNAVRDSVADLRSFNADTQQQLNILNGLMADGGTKAGNSLYLHFKSGASQVETLIASVTSSARSAAASIPLLLPSVSGSVTKTTKRKALGGPVLANTPYLVGEFGPELIIPKTAGTVETAANTRGLLAGSGSSQSAQQQVALLTQQNRLLQQQNALLARIPGATAGALNGVASSAAVTARTLTGSARY